MASRSEGTTAGWPAAVALDLLDRLAVPLSYHGDFDWRGVEICSWLMSCRAVEPWRMSAADYLAAPGGPWDQELGTTMRERGLAVHEEQVVDVVLSEWTGC